MDTVNLFFCCDDAYAPFLAVTIESIREHRDPKRCYLLRILHTGLSDESISRLSTLHRQRFTLVFFDISQKVAPYFLPIRDYFSAATYYRLFIPELFPHLDRGLYLDSDLLVLEDIAKIYDIPLENELVAAASDAFAQVTGPMGRYVSQRLGINPVYHYFNAGVLLMNLRAMRSEGFQRKFLSLLGAVTFNVAQDQDYLNLLCRDRVLYLADSWNVMPIGVSVDEPKLIHFNLHCKPWKGDVPYGDHFWKQAETSIYREELHQIQPDSGEGTRQTEKALAMADEQAADAAENTRIHRRIARVLG